MIMYPADEQAQMDQIIESHPWSSVRYSPVQYQGKRYNKVSSSDLDLMAEVYNRFQINKDPIISGM